MNIVRKKLLLFFSVKDTGLAPGIPIMVFTVLFVSAITWLGWDYCRYTNTKFEVENAEIVSALSSFRSTEGQFTSDGIFHLDDAAIVSCIQNFRTQLQGNLGCEVTQSPVLIPLEGGVLPITDEQGTALRGTIQELRVYNVKTNASKTGVIIDIYTSLDGVNINSKSSISLTWSQLNSMSTLAARSLFGEEIINSASMSSHTSRDDHLILAVKVRFPVFTAASTRLVGLAPQVAYQEKTAVVRWTTTHQKRP